MLKIIKEENRVVGPNNGSNSNIISIPIIGAANCGDARIYADNNIDGYLKVSKKILKKNKKKIYLPSKLLAIQ